jgi:hypothetical protein
MNNLPPQVYNFYCTHHNYRHPKLVVSHYTFFPYFHDSLSVLLFSQYIMNLDLVILLELLSSLQTIQHIYRIFSH